MKKKMNDKKFSNNIYIYFGMKNISFYFIKIMYVIYTIKLKIFKHNIYNNY